MFLQIQYVPNDCFKLPLQAPVVACSRSGLCGAGFVDRRHPRADLLPTDFSNLTSYNDSGKSNDPIRKQMLVQNEG